jgi:hypothetical protein
VKQYSTIFLLLIVLFAAAIFYILTRQPRDVTLKEMLKVNPPPVEAVASQEKPGEVMASQKQPVAVVPIVHDTVRAVPVEKPGALYYIIVESATNQDLARQKAEKLKKTFMADFIILPPTKEGLYRISDGKYSTLEEAKAAIDGVKRKIRSDAWIYTIKK